jgi:hypothetical protein
MITTHGEYSLALEAGSLFENPPLSGLVKFPVFGGISSSFL